MTHSIDDAIAALKRRSPERQRELAGDDIFELAHDEPEEIDPAHRPAVLEGLEQARRREFVSPERVAEAFQRFRE